MRTIAQVHQALLQGQAVTLTITILRGYLQGTRVLRLHPKRFTPNAHRTMAECRQDLNRDIRNFKHDEAPYEKPVYATGEVAVIFPELVVVK